MTITQAALEERVGNIEAAITSIAQSVFAAAPTAPEEFGTLPPWLKKRVAGDTDADMKKKSGTKDDPEPDAKDEKSGDSKDDSEPDDDDDDDKPEWLKKKIAKG